MDSDDIPTPKSPNSEEGTLQPNENAEKDPEPQHDSAHIKYRVEYMNPADTIIHQYDTTGPEYLEDIATELSPTVLELVTTLFTNQEKHDTSSGARPSTRSVPPRKTLHIHSQAIMQVLRSVVQYYPSQDLSSEIIKISAPYTVLVHHYDELMQYREKCKPGSSSTVQLCHREEGAYEHLGILKDFLDTHIMPAVEEEKARNLRGFITFDMRWVEMKPGYTKTLPVKHGKDEAGIIHSFEGGSLQHPKTPWKVWYWVLEYDGDEIGRKLEHFPVRLFDGELPLENGYGDISKLPRDENVESIIRRGHMYWSLLRKQCQWCKGQTMNFPHNEIEGLVMIDVDAYYEENRYMIPELMDTKSDSRSWVSDCTCPVCSGRREDQADNSTAIFGDYTIYTDRPGFDIELSDMQYLLLPGHVWAYVFRTRTWELVGVDSLSEPSFENSMIDNLVMNPRHVDMLKALAKSFARINKFGENSEREPWSADFVTGKGSGLIFLLHGKPGVGKTFTAECIAGYTNRPLMVLTSSDIGVEPNEIENNLTRHFKRAKRWGAVLLIDEADVFMERRSVADLTRNSLVAGFLRALEFYDGILFLTTNRVGSFDDAFLSRIHVQLYYPEFEENDRRKVWQTFINKLVQERGDSIRLNIDAKEYLDAKELKSVKWNGREIRNAFQTAVALAEYEARKDSEGKIVLTDQHLKSVVEMSRDFKKYINDIHQGDEDVRAERRRER